MELARRLGDRLAERAVLAAILFITGLALEIFLIVHRALWLRGLGPICGAHPAALHCPGCYAALSLTLAAVAVAGRPALMPVRLDPRSLS